jgi:hypothetical protein
VVVGFKVAKATEGGAYKPQPDSAPPETGTLGNLRRVQRQELPTRRFVNQRAGDVDERQLAVRAWAASVATDTGNTQPQEYISMIH